MSQISGKSVFLEMFGLYTHISVLNQSVRILPDIYNSVQDVIYALEKAYNFALRSIPHLIKV